jgi:photosystem II stability/assembly factor-like uncharacterized protein
MIAPGTFHAVDFTMQNGYPVVKGIWRSTDWGHTWTAIKNPVWFDASGARYFSAFHGVDRNGITDDGGVTWRRSEYPFQGWSGSDMLGKLFALDSAHYFFAGNYSLFARSTDAGMHWERNGIGSPPYAIAAHNGKVWVGRSFQSLLFSDDYGLTWRDQGREGRLPNELSVIWSLAIPDTMRDPDHIVGVGGFIAADGERRIAMIDSRDGGLNWSEGAALPYTAVSPPLTFRQSADGLRTRGFLYISTRLLTTDDAGATWQQQGTFKDIRLAMADADTGLAAYLDSTSNTWTVAKTTDGGNHWNILPPLPQVYGFPLGLDAIGASEYQFLVARSTAGSTTTLALHHTTDAGTTWQTVRTPTVPKLSGGSVAWVDTLHLYITTSTNVYESNNGGRTFIDVTPSLPSGVFGRDNRYLYHVAVGNRADRLELAPPSTTGVSGPPTASDPAARLSIEERGGNTVLRYSLGSASQVSAVVIDLLGRIRCSHDLGFQLAGNHNAELDFSMLPSGMYTLSLQTATGMKSLKLSIVR